MALPQNKKQGLLEQGQGQEQGQPQEKASPEIQGQFDIFVANGVSVIHDEKVSGGLIDQIVKSDDPIKAMATATLDVVERLETSAKSGGVDLSDAVLVQGANQLMGEIIELVEATGMQPFTDEQKHQAFSLAVSMYLDKAVKTGKITPEELQQMSQNVEQTSDGQRILQRLRSEEGGPAMEQQQLSGGGRPPSPSQIPMQQGAGRV